MVRSFLAVLFAYLLMTLLFTLGFTLLIVVMDENAYEPGSWRLTKAFAIIHIITGIFTGALAALVCRKIVGSTSKAPWALMAVILVVGFATAPTLLTKMSPERAAQTAASIDKEKVDLSPVEHGHHAVHPQWTPWVHPLAGALGVLIVLMLASRKSKSKGPTEEQATS